MRTKFETLESKSVKWTASTGQEIEVKIELVEELGDYFGTGEFERVRGGLTINNTALLSGVTLPDTWIREVNGDAIAVARIGKIGIKTAQYVLIQQAISEVKNHPEFIELTKKITKNDEDAKSYYQHKDAVDRMMTLDGGTY